MDQSHDGQNEQNHRPNASTAMALEEPFPLLLPFPATDTSKSHPIQQETSKTCAFC